MVPLAWFPSSFRGGLLSDLYNSLVVVTLYGVVDCDFSLFFNVHRNGPGSGFFRRYSVVVTVPAHRSLFPPSSGRLTGVRGSNSFVRAGYVSFCVVLGETGRFGSTFSLRLFPHLFSLFRVYGRRLCFIRVPFFFVRRVFRSICHCSYSRGVVPRIQVLVVLSRLHSLVFLDVSLPVGVGFRRDVVFSSSYGYFFYYFFKWRVFFRCLSNSHLGGPYPVDDRYVVRPQGLAWFL